MRDDIPSEIKRTVRQRCGFGCVLCGNALFHYDHMEEYSVTKEHEAENLTLLCADHHDRKTRGLLDVQTVREANAKPYCVEKGCTEPFDLPLSGFACHTILGTNRFSTASWGRFPVIAVDGHELVAVTIDSAGRVLLDMELYDTEDNLLLRVEENAIVIQTPNVWDIEFVGKRDRRNSRLHGGGLLIVRHALRDVALQMEFRGVAVGRDTSLINIRITKGDIHYRGAHVVVTKDCIGFGGSSTALFGSKQFNTAGGLSVGTPAVPGAAFGICQIPRFNRMSEEQRKANIAAIQQIRPPEDLDQNAGSLGYYISTCPVNLHVVSVEQDD